MTAPNTTRRAFLGAVPAVAIGMVATTPASATTAGIGPVMARALAEHAKVRAEYEAFRLDVFDPIERAFFEARAAIPHHTTVNSFKNVLETESRLSTDSPSCVAVARRALADIEAGKMGRHPTDADYVATVREVCAAADARTSEEKRLDALHGYTAADARMSDYCHADGDAIAAVINTPSASFADLLAKVNFIQADDLWDHDAATDQITADIRRLGRVS